MSVAHKLRKLIALKQSQFHLSMTQSSPAVCAFVHAEDLVLCNSELCASIVCEWGCEGASFGMRVCVSACLSVLTSDKAAMAVSHQLTPKSPWVLRQTFCIRCFYSLLSITSSASLSFLLFIQPLTCHLLILWVSILSEPVIIGLCTDSQTMPLNHREHFCLLWNIGKYSISTWLNFHSLVSHM